MRRVLPPLNPLRSFEAAARHLSFTLAAKELSVSQVAVSRQVSVLEDYLEVSLFERGYQLGIDHYPWTKTPPGLETTVQARDYSVFR